MKIASITTSPIPSSTAHSIQALKASHALAQNGHLVLMWVPQTPASEEERSWPHLQSHYGLPLRGAWEAESGAQSTNFNIYWLTSRRAFRRYDFAWEAVKQAGRWGADLVYTWTLQAAVLALWQNLPVVLEMHDRPTGRLGPVLFRQAAGRKGRLRLAVITAALHARLEAMLGRPLRPGEAVIAPNGTDPQRYACVPSAEEARRQLGFAPRFTAAYTGHFYPGRGADLLLELARRLPQVQFLWVGGAARAVDEWKVRLKEEGIGNVILTGFVENHRLPLYQAAADVLLMPYETRIEGSSGGNSADICSPMKMFDYLASGKAILSSDLPVFHEVLNAQNAVFCQPGSVNAWSAALAALADDAPRRTALGEQARRDAARYAWQERARSILAGFPL